MTKPKYQITCINKDDRLDPNDRILNVGGILENGFPWVMTVDQAAEHILHGRHEFFVEVDNIAVEVDAVPLNGRYYLRTRRDTEEVNNLLSLPECEN